MPDQSDSEPIKDSSENSAQEPEPIDVNSLWDIYYPRLKIAIASQVRRINRAVADESAIALSAFNAFIEGAKTGRYPNLNDHDHIWRLIRTIAIRKTSDHRKRLLAQKRGGDQIIVGQSDYSGESGMPRGVDAVAGQNNNPTIDLEVSELLNSMLQQLPDDRHRDVILLKLQGASVSTIAECLATTTRTVQRLLKKIENQWEAELLNSE